MKNSLLLILMLMLMLSAGAGMPAPAGGVTGTFIQLTRATAGQTPAQWTALLNRMQAVGITTLIVQWTAEAPALYFKSRDLDFDEQYDVLERLLEAARSRPVSIILGLQNDPAFWREITGRDQALRDYFLERLARNERLQSALLKSFGTQTNWVGYYIPDEIDDLTWRAPARRRILKDYLRQTIRSLKAHDGNRSVAVSAFVRVRTSPDLAAGTLRSLTMGIGLDTLLIQDGAGENNPAPDAIRNYYHALRAAGPWREPQLWAVLETFRQTSANNTPFVAEPAPPDGFSGQVEAAAEFEHRILFTFPDYMDPPRGPAARALYRCLESLSGLTEKPKAKP